MVFLAFEDKDQKIAELSEQLQSKQLQDKNKQLRQEKDKNEQLQQEIEQLKKQINKIVMF